MAIAGKVKAGKSTLLNALVGDHLAPTDAGECTRVVTWYRDAHTYRVEAYGKDGTVRQCPFRRRDDQLEIDLGGTPAEDLDRLVVWWPSASLSEVTLIDTPGIGSISTDLSARTYDVPHHRRGGAGRRRRRPLPGAPPAQHRRPLPGGLPRRRPGPQHAGQRRRRAVPGRRDRGLPARRHGLGPPGGRPLRARSPHPPAVPVGDPGGGPRGPGRRHAPGGRVPGAVHLVGPGAPGPGRAGPDRRPVRGTRRRRRRRCGRAVAPPGPARAVRRAPGARPAGPAHGHVRPELAGRLVQASGVADLQRACTYSSSGAASRSRPARRWPPCRRSWRRGRGRRAIGSRPGPR